MEKMDKPGKQWVNGLFITKKDGQFGEFLSISLKKNEFIKQLEELEADEKGFINFTSNPQRVDPNKYATTVNTWRPESRAPLAQEPTSVVDDLPF